MKRWIYRIVAGLALAGLVLLVDAWLSGDAATEATDPPVAWQSMNTAELAIEPLAPLAGGPDTLSVRVAETAAQRAQGMQHLPARLIRDHPIWFVFEEPRQVSWHMRNVRLALDIAYVDREGRVIAMERMEPETRGYGLAEPIAAALELAAGEAQRLGIQPGTRLTLKEPD